MDIALERLAELRFHRNPLRSSSRFFPGASGPARSNWKKNIKFCLTLMTSWKTRLYI